MSNEQPKWTEIEHLPEWDEEFYEVYTAKKHGKWVMLKTLKPELRDKDEYRDMIEKEFDVRYNLAHPNIIMINDFEDVPGLGTCIITDDVYGDSLRKLLDKGEVNADIQEKIVTRLVDAISYIQTNHIVHHPIRPETIIFTEKIRNLKVIDVGFDQREHLTPADASEDIYNFGKVLGEVLSATGDRSPRLHRVVEKCTAPDPARRFRDVPDLRMALSGTTNKRLYVVIISFLLIMIAILGWLCIKNPAL
ncbi:MAG: protein kinase [Muribaculaceae bacterium]|nr:protein kinase [Muribaculaceae bacterium]